MEPKDAESPRVAIQGVSMDRAAATGRLYEPTFDRMKHAG